jgi:hypothetical protein
MGILKTLFYAFLIYYGWKLVKLMFFTPVTPQDNQQHSNPTKGKKINGDSEYIDYEEVK